LEFPSSRDAIEDIINHNNSNTFRQHNHNHNHFSYLHSITRLFATLKMRATTTILFIAGFIGAAFAADTKQFSDENWYVASVALHPNRNSPLQKS
jgi:hypothetical protein